VGENPLEHEWWIEPLPVVAIAQLFEQRYIAEIL
jgi:hypothetical protein